MSNIGRLKPKPSLRAFNAGIREANRRERGEFDGLFGQLPQEASQLLKDIVSDLRDCVLRKCTKKEARRLLRERVPQERYRNLTPISEDVELALCLLNNIRSAMRSKDDDPGHPDYFTTLIFGKVGVRDKNRNAGTRKERRRDITEWLEAQLRRNPSAKSPELWSIAPLFIKDQIGLERFKKRLTAARKKGRK